MASPLSASESPTMMAELLVILGYLRMKMENPMAKVALLEIHPLTLQQAHPVVAADASALKLQILS